MVTLSGGSRRLTLVRSSRFARNINVTFDTTLHVYLGTLRKCSHCRRRIGPVRPASLNRFSCHCHCSRRPDSRGEGSGAVDTPKRKSRSPAETAEVRFADGSIVCIFLTEPAIEMTTRYGKPSVPVGDIRRIELGFRYPEGVLWPRSRRQSPGCRRMITKYAKPPRKSCSAFASWPTCRSSDRPRAPIRTSPAVHIVIRKLEETVGRGKAQECDLDMIHAAEFTVSGKVDAPALKGRTTYFGEVTLQVAQVRTIRFLADPSGNRTGHRRGQVCSPVPGRLA